MIFDYTELHHIQYLQQTTPCYTPLQPYLTKIQQRKKYLVKMNYNASNKTNFYNDKSQYTNKLKTMIYITLDQITPTALAGTRLHI